MLVAGHETELLNFIRQTLGLAYEIEEFGFVPRHQHGICALALDLDNSELKSKALLL